ncbi:PH domain-containing protein [Patiriisocius sp. Uisw_017]|uniref:PH domain-containing protein n=1 Tax=Patiriisocius sp. Uisw_017 TaxID=3230968 RepID=UPI0039EC2E0D
MTKKYSSKVSYGLLTVVFVVFFSPLILNLIKSGINLNLTLISIFLIIIFGLITHMFLKTEYIIEDKKLKIKCGFFTYKPIEINEIREITKSSNIISSPAASFDRIEIKYGKFEELIISPKNKFEFAQYLTNLNLKIKNNITEE